MSANYIVYQAYGSKDILNEALYSILSFYEVYGLEQKDIKVVVYTDSPTHFESILGKERVECRLIDAEIIRKWRGEIDFVHRVKIETLLHFSKNLVDDNILYLDSDIYFVQDVTAIFEHISKGNFYMHDEEGALNCSKFPLILKMGKFIKSHRKELQKVGIAIPDNTKTWNAGVIGFNTSNKYVLQKVLCFTDSFYKIYPKHIAEQFGFSLYLGKEGKVLTARHQLFHYWSFKEFRAVLYDFFEYHRGTELALLLKELKKVSPIVLGQPKNEYDTMHWLPKAFRKMKKNRWVMPNYKYWEQK